MKTPRRRIPVRLPRPWPVLTALLIAATVAGCRPCLPPAGVPAPGTYRSSFEHGGRSRDFLIHLPAGFSGRQRAPLLLVLHGGGGTGAQMAEVTGFSRIADRDGYVVLYPDGLGLGLPPVFGRTWNAGHCCGRPYFEGVDDVGFLAQLLGAVTQRFAAIDRDRIFVAGYSNGGLLAFRLASELSEQLAAVAVYGATMPAEGSVAAPRFTYAPPRSPISVLTIHSLADPWVAYAGSPAPQLLNASVPQVGRFWAVAAGCPARARRSRAVGGAVLADRYTGCRGGAEVTQLALLGWDHQWPGPANLRELAAHPLRDFDAAEEMAAFFAGKRRAGALTKKAAPAHRR